MTRQSRTLAFVNQKGGVCKTTLCAQVAYGLARFHNKRVLAIDLDPQANLTLALGCQDMATFTTYEVLDSRRIREADAIQVEENLFLLRSSINLARAEMGFIGRADMQFLLQKALNSFRDVLARPFDFILIDSPPNLGLLTLNALMAASEFIVPLTCDVYAMNGLNALMDTFKTVQEMNPKLILSGVVPCRVDVRRTIDKQGLARMEEEFGDLMFKARIPENTALKEAGGHGKAIWDHDPKSLAAPALAGLCEEILEKVQELEEVE